VLKIFAGQNNPFLDNVKTFRWWGAASRRPAGSLVSVPARFNDRMIAGFRRKPPVGVRKFWQRRFQLMQLIELDERPQPDFSRSWFDICPATGR
jgi:hypothetical protein